MLPKVYAETQATESLIRTNAQGGLYSKDQQCWFSVPEQDRLRVRLNDELVYQGPGPASVLLSVKKGEERQFKLIAERRSPPPEDSLLESRAFMFYIDRKSPPAPRLSLVVPTGGPGSRTLAVETEPNSRVDAIVDKNGTLQTFQDLRTGVPFTGPRWSLIAWAKDTAGNWSAPLVTTLEDLRLDVANPAPGTWSNRQMLILSSQGGTTPRWTTDGKDPLGPTGQNYTKPLLLDLVGEVTLRLAVTSSDGRRLDKTISYRVVEPSGVPLPPELGVLESMQNKPIEKDTPLGMPKQYRWAVSSMTVNNPSRRPLPLNKAPVEGNWTLTLRPVPGLSRPVALELGAGDRRFRFAYQLGTTATDPAHRPLSPPLSSVPLPRSSESPVSSQSTVAPASSQSTVSPASASSGPETDKPENAESPPTVVRAGTARVAFWPAGGDEIRYTLKAQDAWKTVDGPIALPPSATVLRWIVERSAAILGPYELPLPAIADLTEDQSSGIDHVEFRDHGSSSETWNYAALDPSSMPRELKAPSVDVCDGEDLDIRLVAPDGRIVTTARLDRRAPEPPVLSAPAEGSFVSGAPTIGLSLSASDAQDGEVRPYLRLVKTYNTGKTVELRTEKPITLDRELGAVYTVSLEAYSEDQAGNRSDRITRNFTVDNEAIYVLSGASGGDGSRSFPLSSLDQALALQKKDGRGVIKIAGDVPLLSRWTFDGSLTIQGSFDRSWKSGSSVATVQYQKGAGLDITQGETSLLSLRFIASRPATVVPNSRPLITLSSSGSLNLDTVEMSGTTTLIDNIKRSLNMTNSLLTLQGEPGLSTSALRVQGGNAVVNASRIEVSGDRTVAWEQTGGELRIRDSYFVVRSDKTATGLLLRDLHGNMEDLSVQATGVDYGNILDMTGGTLVWKGGTLQVKGRDAVSFLLDGVQGLFTGLTGTIDSTFVGRGFEIWKEFPQVHSCIFTYGGSSKKSELFSASHETTSIDPPPKSITGNTIKGFTNLLDSRFLGRQAASFNDRYAQGGTKNLVILEENAP